MVCLSVVSVCPNRVFAKAQAEPKIGAYYYAWYGIDSNDHWKNGIKKTPFIGYYNSSDPRVADQHILLAKQHGIDFFAVSWIGEGKWHNGDFSTIDQNLRSGLLQAPHLENYSFCLFYETVLVKDNAVSEQKNFSGIFLNDLAYAANNYFNVSSYLHVNNETVLFIYDVPYFYRNSTSQTVRLLFDEARRELAAVGVNLYIVGDMGNVTSPSDLDPDWLYSMNATTNYFFSDPKEGWDGVLADVNNYYPEWASAMESQGIDFIPDVYSGFNNTNNLNVSPPWAALPRNTTAFGDMLQVARANANPSRNGDDNFVE